MDLVDFILWLSTTGELKHLVSLFNWWEPFSKKDLLVLVQWIFHNWWSLNHHFYLHMLRFPIIPFSAWRFGRLKQSFPGGFFDPHFFYTEKITWVCCWIGKKHLWKSSWKPGNSGLLKPSILRVSPPLDLSGFPTKKSSGHDSYSLGLHEGWGPGRPFGMEGWRLYLPPKTSFEGNTSIQMVRHLSYTFFLLQIIHFI